MISGIHICTDGRATYCPALDSTATHIPGGAKVKVEIKTESIPDFDYNPIPFDIYNGCFICAYADGLRTGTIQPEVVYEGKRSLKSILSGLTGFAKKAIADRDEQKMIDEDKLILSLPSKTFEKVVVPADKIPGDIGFQRVLERPVLVPEVVEVTNDFVPMVEEVKKPDVEKPKVEATPIRVSVPLAPIAKSAFVVQKKKKDPTPPPQGSLF
jgi:hypothetical protein